ncbi:MAG: hypothetical protein CBC35_10255 [Planctomycetes bacterium TMED75]|nr:hypothetical protein [Planctomycetaceae bacterium]OUU91138.1 MAG: hypothetical protein CBC35_10255 [Planctomycetes bacterium TMED75]
MSSKRSTRRSVNPPEEDDNPKAVGDEGGLGDVKSILNEIEDLVSGVGTDETARPTSVVEDHAQPDLEESPVEARAASIGEVEDVKQLNGELDAAIASVHGSALREGTTTTASTPESNSLSSRDREEPDSAAVSAAEEVALKSHEEEQVLPTPESERASNGVVKLLSAPMEALSRRNRLLVTVFAVSMALWVPVVWMAALMTNPEISFQAPETLSLTDAPPDQGNEVLSEK